MTMLWHRASMFARAVEILRYTVGCRVADHESIGLPLDTMSTATAAKV